MDAQLTVRESATSREKDEVAGQKKAPEALKSPDAELKSSLAFTDFYFVRDFLLHEIRRR